MTIDGGPRPDTLDRARALVSAMERGAHEEANALLDDLTRLRERELFAEMGALTRQLHEALASLRLDISLSESAAQAMPDAKERLDYVVAKTEEAAHRTLGAVEASLPIAEQIRSAAEALHAEWERFQRKELSAEQFRALARETSEFVGGLGADAATIHEKLGEVLMAQDFQDITGQVIRRVIEIVQEVEAELVRFVRVRGGAEQPAEPSAAQTSPSRGHGPAIGGKSTGEYVNGQDDVDDLLSSLGF